MQTGIYILDDTEILKKQLQSVDKLTVLTSQNLFCTWQDKTWVDKWTCQELSKLTNASIDLTSQVLETWLAPADETNVLLHH